MMANELPPCKYGGNCYRKNADHLRQFWHPPASTATPASESGDPPAGRREDNGFSDPSKHKWGLTREEIEYSESAGGEWELDDYDNDGTASLGAEFQELPLSKPEETKTAGSDGVDATVLLILVGLPGSGKSTFCNKLMSVSTQPWTRICQDVISNGRRGSKQQCLKQAESALRQGRNVVIDRCNIDKQQRSDFLELGARLRVSCHSVALRLPVKLCIERALQRVAHEGGVHVGNAGAIINRVSRSYQLPSLGEGFIRIRVCKTDTEVQKVLTEYTNFQTSGLDPAPYDKVNSAGKELVQEEREKEVTPSSSTYKLESSMEREGVRTIPASGDSEILFQDDDSSAGAKTLAFPSISTADFQFDSERASSIIVDSVSGFFLKERHSGLKLVLVDLSSKSHILSLVKRKAIDKGLDPERFMTYAGDITKLKSLGGPPCAVITNAANWRLKAGGGGVNAAIYKAAGPEFEQATKGVAATLRPGTSIIVPLPLSSPLKKQGVTHVIHVLGPNMNPQRPNCLGNDYVEGSKLLRNAYASMFENFACTALGKAVEGKDKVVTVKPNVGKKLNAFEVLMQAAKRKGEVPDTELRREKGEKVRIVEEGAASLAGSQAEHALPQLRGQSSKTINQSVQGLQTREGTEVRSSGSTNPHDRKVERRWDGWALALYKVALQPDEDKSALLETTDFAVVLEDKFPKAKRHLLVVSRTQGLDALEDVRLEHLAILEQMHSLGESYAASLLREEPSLVFRLGYHSAPSMRQLHLHVISQDFNSSCLKHKKHWNSFTTSFFLDSVDVINEVRTKGRVNISVQASEKMLQQLELRCHRCRSVQPNIPRLKQHILTCTRPVSTSSYLINST